MAMMDEGFHPLPERSSVVLGVLEGNWGVDIDQAFRGCLGACDFKSMPISLPLMAAAHQAGLAIISAENWTAFGSIVDHPELGEDIRLRLRASSEVAADQLANAREIQAQFRAEVDAALAQVDALILPSLPSPAPLLEEARDPAKIVDHTRLLRPFNVSGHPAISLPYETDAGEPFGIQIVGRRMADEELCAIAREVERRITKSVPMENLS